MMVLRDGKGRGIFPYLLEAKGVDHPDIDVELDRDRVLVAKKKKLQTAPTRRPTARPPPAPTKKIRSDPGPVPETATGHGPKAGQDPRERGRTPSHGEGKHVDGTRVGLEVGHQGADEVGRDRNRKGERGGAGQGRAQRWFDVRHEMQCALVAYL